MLDTSVLVRAWLSPSAVPNPSRRVMLLAGIIYDSFTSPAILDEVEEVLARPRLGAANAQVRLWLDVFLRASRQVFPQLIPAVGAGAVRGDADDLPVLHTAYAANAAGEDGGNVLEAARTDGGWFLVSENTRDFTPGWNVHGWQYITANEFLRVLQRRGRVSPRDSSWQLRKALNSAVSLVVAGASSPRGGALLQILVHVPSLVGRHRSIDRNATDKVERGGTADERG